MSEAEDKALARKGRIAGLVITVTMTLWVLLQWVAPAIGLPGRYALLFDFAALAALFWAMVVIYQMWQARAASRENQR
tara:strand:+ start:179 stop:412 length:234 start_codon:yes stop_codon:yes gene_type:complete